MPLVPEILFIMWRGAIFLVESCSIGSLIPMHRPLRKSNYICFRLESQGGRNDKLKLKISRVPN